MHLLERKSYVASSALILEGQIPQKYQQHKKGNSNRLYKFALEQWPTYTRKLTLHKHQPMPLCLGTCVMWYKESLIWLNNTKSLGLNSTNTIHYLVVYSIKDYIIWKY